MEIEKTSYVMYPGDRLAGHTSYGMYFTLTLVACVNNTGFFLQDHVIQRMLDFEVITYVDMTTLQTNTSPLNISDGFVINRGFLGINESLIKAVMDATASPWGTGIDDQFFVFSTHKLIAEDEAKT